MSVITIGKSRVRVDVEGCIDCGAGYSSGWTLVRTIGVVVNGRKPFELDLMRCAECQDKHAALNPALPFAEGGLQ